MRVRDLAIETLVFRFHQQSRYSVAALLGAVEVDPHLVDLRVLVPSEIPDNLIREELQSGNVAIAYSVMSTQLQRVEYEVRHLRDVFGDQIVLMAGGPHASTRPMDLVDMGFDIVVVGEGERVFPEILRRLTTGKSVDEIAGVVTADTKIIPKPRDLPRVNLDEYPPFAIGRNIVGPIEVTRGCPFKCKFCSTPFLTGGVVRHRSIERVRFWLQQAVEKRGFKRAWFLSPNALSYGGHGRRTKPEKLKELLERTSTIDGLDELYFGSFPSEVRPEFVTHEILRMMRKYVANTTLQIGLQSGSDRVLEICNRHHTVDDGINAARIALDTGFIPHIDMIFGLPGETPADRERSIRICEELIDMGAKIHAHVFMPLPGSDFASMPPGELDTETRRRLGDLSRKGFVTGSWGNQERIARHLATLRHRKT
ncbi:MAG: TIGR04013 family B12-binding domain/radical SAM domain-containing protein [Candidatus Thorarchaeota archaeon]